MAAKGSWVVNQHFALASSPSGLGYMNFNYVLPDQFSTSVTYPVLFVGHPLDSGMNGSSYPKDGTQFVNAQMFDGSTYTLDTMFNSVNFRAAHSCVVVACQCDQTIDTSGANGNSNFGGYNDSQNSGWNENAVNGILQAFIAGSIVTGLKVASGQRYHIGYSLGGIATLAYLVDNNQWATPTGGLSLWTAGITFSDQLFRPGTSNSSVFSRMSTVPLMTISQDGHNDPTSYDQPAWQTYTGNSNWPTKSMYDSGGMASIRAASTQYYYINFGSSDPSATFMAMNADGGDGTTLYAWLFSQVFGGAAPPPSPPPTATPTFSDPCTSLSLHRAWQSGDKWQLIAPDTPDGRGGPALGESGTQWWTNPFNPNTAVSGLYQIAGGGLQLGVMATPSAYQSYINTQSGTSLPYVAALLNSSQTNYQKYGYWEIVVTVPRIPGFTFQADLENFQITRAWPPEIDLRIYTDGSNVQTVLFQVALSSTSYLQYTISSNAGFDATISHTYGISWQSDFITFYIDNTQAAQFPTPTTGAYTTNPMFLFLLSAANYVGTVNPSTASLPAYATVKSVNVYTAKPAVAQAGLTIVTPGQQNAGAAFAVSGGVSGYATPPTLNFSVNGSAFAALPVGFSVTTSSFSFTCPALSAAANNTIVVRDANNTSVSVSTGSFAVVAPVVPVITPSLPSFPVSGISFSESGGMTGYASAPSLTFADDGGAAVALPSGAVVTSATFTFAHPGLATGNHTTVVSDGSNPPGSTGSYAVTPITGGASPNPTVITPGGSFNDAAGNRWSISAGGLVVLNGTDDTTTRNVIEMAWVNGVIWQENSSQNWYSKTTATSAWSSATTTSPLAGLPTITINAVANPQPNTAFTINGGLANYGTTVPSLTFKDNTAAATAFPSGSQVTSTTFSFLHPALPVGNYTTTISDGTYSAAVSYSVVAAGWTSLPATTSLTNSITGLIAATAYDIEVYATNSVGQGPPSAIITATTATVAVVLPGAPTGLSSSAVTQTTVTLSWVAPTTGTTPFTYATRWSPSGANTWTAGPSVSTPSAQIAGLTASTSYDFEAAAINSAGQGPWSAPLTITTAAAAVPTVTWSAGSITGPVTLSNGNLTAAFGGSTTANTQKQSVWSTTSQNTGSYSFEVTMPAITQNCAIGLAMTTHSGALELGADATSVGYYPSTGTGSQPAQTMWINNALILNPSGNAPGTDVGGATFTFCINLSLSPAQWWVTGPAMRTAYGAAAWNDSATANPATGAGGVALTGLSGALSIVACTAEGGGSATINAGSSAFSRSVPSTFPPWGGAGVTVVVPGSVTGLTAGTPSSTSVTLSWAAPATGTTPFTYVIMQSPSGAGTFAQVGTSTTTSTTISSGLTAGSAYDFRVFASNSAGNGGNSNTVTVTMATVVSVPGAPSGLSAGTPTSTTVPLTWQAPTTGSAPNGYQVQYKLSTAGSYSSFTPTASTTSQTITGLSPSLAYNFQVYAFNAAGNGVVSSPPVTVTTAATDTVALRNWFDNMGQDGSMYVQPFYSSATWDTTSAAHTQLFSGTATVNQTGNYSAPFYRGLATDPSGTVTDGKNTITVHLPAGAQVEQPASANDQSIGGLDRSKPYLYWNISGATIDGSVTGTWKQGSVIRGTYGFMVGDASGLILEDVVTGTFSQNAMGNIQEEELLLANASGSYILQHMLCFQAPFSSFNGTHIWPLSANDTGGTGLNPEGTVIGILPSDVRPTGKTRGWYLLYDNLKQVGWILYNISGTPGINIMVNSRSSGTAALATDIANSINDVLSRGAILTNQTGPASVKGFATGATSLYPPPPLLDYSPTGGNPVLPSTFGAWYPGGYNVPSVKPTPTPTPTTAFSISKGKIIDPKGAVWVGKGINAHVDQLPTICTNTQGQPLTTKFPGINYVRVNYEGSNNPFDASGLEPYISRLTALNILCVIEDHTGISQDPYTGTILVSENSWFSSMAKTYKTNPYVAFGTFNEPGTPSVVLSSIWTQQKSNLDTIRGTGSNALVFLQLPHGGNPGTVGTSGRGQDGTGPVVTGPIQYSNVVWGLHYYDWAAGKPSSGFATDAPTIKASMIGSVVNAMGIVGCQSIQSLDGVVPVVIEEFGISTTGSLPDDAGGVTLVDVVCQSAGTDHSGFAAWGWSTGGTSDILIDGSGNLTTYGLQVASYISAGTGTESADKTSVPPATSINASPIPGSAGSGNVLTITSGAQIALDGSVLGGANVTQLYYTNHTGYQKNSSGNWYGPISSAGTGTGVPDPTGTTPAPAQASGYTTRVFYDNFQFNTVAAPNGSFTPSSGGPQFPNWWIQANSGATTSQVSVSGGLLRFVSAANNDSSQAQLATGKSGGPLSPTSTPTAHATNTGTGLAFGYGYFKVVMAFASTGSGGWPAFFMTNSIDPAIWPDFSVPAHIEIDILEFEASAPNSTVWQWGKSPVSYQYNIASKYAGGAQSALTTPSGWDTTKMNAYGCLWTPNGIGFYLNDVLVSYVASSLKSFNPLPLPDNNFPSGTITNWPNGVHGCGLVLGAGSSWNITVSSAEVWQ